MTTGTAARTTCNKALPRVSNETIPLSSNQGLRILRLSLPPRDRQTPQTA